MLLIFLSINYRLFLFRFVVRKKTCNFVKDGAQNYLADYGMNFRTGKLNRLFSPQKTLTMKKPISILLIFLLLSPAVFAQTQKRVSQVTAWLQDHEKNRPKQKISLKTFNREGLLLEEYDYENEFYQSYAYNAQGKILKHIVRSADIEETVTYSYMSDMTVRIKNDAVTNSEEKITWMLDANGRVIERITNEAREIYRFNEFDSLYEIQALALGGYGRKKRTFIDYDRTLRKRVLQADYDYNDQLVFERRIKYNNRGAITEESERDFRFNIFKLNTYTYDESGRLTVHEFSDFGKKEHQILTYTYFPDSQISQISKVTVSNDEGKLSEFTTFEYRSGIRFKSTTYRGNEKVITLFDNLGYKLSETTYDSDRLVRTITYEYKYF